MGRMDVRRKEKTQKRGRKVKMERRRERKKRGKNENYILFFIFAKGSRESWTGGMGANTEHD